VNPSGIIGWVTATGTGTGVWTEVKGLPVARQILGAGVVNGALYAVGGDNATNVYRYDVTNWTPVAGLRSMHFYFALGESSNALYLAGDRLCATNAYCFDGTNWISIPQLPVCRFGLAMGVLSGELYAAGGSLSSAESVKNNVYRFNGSSWSEIASMPNGRYGLAVGTLNGALYAMGGRVGGVSLSADVYRFAGDSWTTVASLPAAREYMGAGTLGGAIYAVGGEGSGGPSTNVFRYDGTNWTEVAGLPARRQSHAVSVLNNALYVIGGYDGSIVCTNVFRFTLVGGFVTNSGVSPESCSSTGGATVTIGGSDLCNGTLADVTSVTLCGVPATVVGVSGQTQIVVAAGMSGVAIASGSVSVVSAAYGTTTRNGIFSYTGPSISVLGTNGAAIVGHEAPSTAKGTDFGSRTWGGSVTNQFVLTNGLGGAATILGVSTSGTGAAHFRVVSTPAAVAAGAVGQFRVAYEPTHAGTHQAAVAISFASFSQSYLINLSGTAVKRGQAIAFASPGGQVTTNRVGLAASADSGLPVSFSADGPANLSGTNLSFTGAGAVRVVADGGQNADWHPAPEVTNTIAVSKATATVSLGGLLQTNNGLPRVVTASTAPPGLAVDITYNGGAVAPVASGSYAVTGTVNDALYQGAQGGTLVVVDGVPLIEVTNLDAEVAFSVSTWTLGGTANEFVSGTMRWTNVLTGGSGPFAAQAAWSVPGIALAVGTNLLVASGSNSVGGLASDSVRVVRVSAPVLDVTNVAATVRYSTTAYALGGTGAGLSGHIRWTNALSGTGGSIPAASPFSLATILLGIGANTITVSGSNQYGDIASDAVVITRGGLGTDLPYVHITNTDASVANEVAVTGLGGTNNAHVVGQLSWTNSLGGGGSLPAALQWQVPGIALSVGTNVIRVWGTNTWGEASTGTVRVVRSANVPRGDYFTELFAAADHDLDFTTLTFTPAATSNFYAVCRAGGVGAFPVDPAGGSALALDDDSAAMIVVTGGASVALYGGAATNIFVGSNGYLTLTEGDLIPVEGLDNHFRLPRIAMLYDDLDPGLGGTISWKQLADRVVLTYQGVPEYGYAARTNSFQVSWYFSGVIQMTWLHISATDGLVGLSEGVGRAAHFAESDLSSYGLCSDLSHTLLVSSTARGQTTPVGEVAVPQGGHASFTLAAEPYFHVGGIWTNSVLVGMPYPASLTNLVFWWSNVVAIGSLHVEFLPNLAIHGVPEWWLAGHRLTNGTWDAAALDDQDDDGSKTWEEYVADTQPTSQASRLRVTELKLGASPACTFTPASTGRVYAIDLSTNLPQGLWAPLSLMVPGTNVFSSLSATGPVSQGAIRVRVQVP